jgi:hypothetical protein
VTCEQYIELSINSNKIRNIVITYILFKDIDKVVFLSQVFGSLIRCMKDIL